MIGLQRGIVALSAHRDGWKDAYEAERSRLCAVASHLLLDVQHVGSTAIPGLPAKPIIDMAATIASKAQVPPLADVLVRNGWTDRGDKGQEGGHLFVKYLSPDVRTHHLHVVEADDPQWREYLTFRDTLRSDERIRRAYGRLKRRLQHRFPRNRPAYTAAKSDFIASVLASQHVE